MSEVVLITGGTGFVGSHLVETLLAAGQQQLHVTSSSARPSYVSKLLPAEQIHQLDLNDAAATTELISTLRPTQIYHLAAAAAVGSSFDQAHYTLTNNITLQLSLLEAVRQVVPSARLLIVGSGMEYDVISYPSDQPIAENHPLGPANPYAISKTAQELLGLAYAYSYQLDVVRARPFNHTGERQTTEFAVPSFAHQIVKIERGQQAELNVGNLDAVRDFTDVKDVCQAYLTLLERGQTRQAYNIGSGHGVRMSELLDQLCQLSSTRVTITTDPTKIRPLDVPRVVADNRKIVSLGWQPTTPLTDTLQRVLAYWRAQP